MVNVYRTNENVIEMELKDIAIIIFSFFIVVYSFLIIIWFLPDITDTINHTTTYNALLCIIGFSLLNVVVIVGHYMYKKYLERKKKIDLGYMIP